MSLTIKGMEMPQAGDMIICGQINGKLQCTIVTRGKSTKWCEVSEVSAPHGRLIDENELLRHKYGFSQTARVIIKTTDAVIEAEVSE